MGNTGDELADAREFLALHELRLGGLEGFDRAFEIFARALQILGHLIEHPRQLPAFVVRSYLDALREITLADRFRAGAEGAQRLRDAANQKPYGPGADQHREQADAQQNL